MADSKHENVDIDERIAAQPPLRDRPGSQRNLSTDDATPQLDTRGMEIRPVRDQLPTVILTQHLVQIVRDPMIKIPKTVFDHELPILEAINGEENVERISDEEVEVTNFDVGAEYDRLVRVYGAGSPGAVEQVYGQNPRDLADELGLEYKVRAAGARKARVVPASLQVDNSAGASNPSLAGVDAGDTSVLTRTADLPGQNARSDRGPAAAAARGDASLDRTATVRSATTRSTAQKTAAKPKAAAKPAAKATVKAKAKR